MKRNYHICFITGRYPSGKTPSNIFVAQLISAIADQGVRCTVIAPQSVSNQILRKSEHTDRKREIVTHKGNIITIFSPRYLSFSSKKFFVFNTINLTVFSSLRVALKEYKKQKIEADMFYGHFISPNGIIATELGKRYNKPSFFANGEDSLSHLKNINHHLIESTLSNISGIVAVSSKNKQEIFDMFPRHNLAGKVQVFPNGIDNTVFYQMSRFEARKQLGFNQKVFIVVFTGSFSHRKGSARLSKALDELEDVYSIFIGEGASVPTCKNILFSGPLAHGDINLYLNAANVFVLPTLSEGCSNAIVEAMAVGLPVISSDGKFNDDILTAGNSIRIDPENIEQIKNAILELYHNPELQRKMGIESQKIAKELTVEARATNILQFLSEMSSKSGIS